MASNKLAVIIPTVNQFELLAKCLHSIESRDMVWQPFIIDNWNENIGVAAGWNKGIEAARKLGFDWFLVLNDDTQLSPFTIDMMRLELLKNPSAGMVSGNNIGQDPEQFK